MAEVAKLEGVGKSTITTWLREESSEKNASQSSTRHTSEEKFQIIMETFALNEAELSEYARKNGLFVADIKKWKENCISANEKKQKLSAVEKKSLEESLKREKELIKTNKSQEKELIRNKEALAEAAALLLLSKKAKAIWGEPEDE